MGKLTPGLYAITDSRLCPPDQLVTAVEAAVGGGAVMVQYREKQAPAPEKLRQARDLSAVCRAGGALFLINDDPELARRVNADGVHVGQDDESAAAARQRLGEHAVIGVTCHGRLALAEAARGNGADYVAFGRFYTSGTKPDAPEADLSVLSNARPLGLPVCAIGGITIDNGAPLIQAGADLLAVVGGLFGGRPDEIEQRARAFSRLFARHHPLFSASR
ncbi:thiamine phosphate synthase [Marinobacter sp. C2H3]|uniref:thiamine phosphate synthase n=1 Tax=Marinobacter sp. C2H3 TaxID=3119003 RepID=UPI00300E93B5